MRATPLPRAFALLAALVVAAPLLVPALPAKAQRGQGTRTMRAPAIEIESRVNAQRVQVGDTFQLDVVLTVRTSGEPDELLLPDLSDFKVVRADRGPSTSRTSIINGRVSMSRTYVYTYLLRATSPGKKTIGAARARLGRHTATAPAIPIEVVAGAGAMEGTGTSSDLDPSARFSERAELPPFFLDVRFDRDEVYVGEQVLLSVEVYAREFVDLDLRGFDAPEPTGFWVEVLESPGRVRPTQRTVRERPYLVYPVLRMALFPLDAGEHVLEPLSIALRTSRGPFGQRQERIVESEPVSLRVRPLPEEGQPDGFPSGNVGQLSLRAVVDKREVAAGELVTLKLIASGEGNISAVTLPDVASAIEGARVFPPTFEERRGVQNGRLYGEKEAEVLVQPQGLGVLEIPTFRLPYFDPKTERYAVAESAPLAVRVTGRAGGGAAAASGRRVIDKAARPIARGLEPARDPRPAFARPSYLVACAGILGLGGVLFALGARRRRALTSAEGAAKRQRRERKRALARALEERDLAAAQRAFEAALAARAGNGIRALPKEELVSALFAAGLSAALAREAVFWLEAAEAARYAPKSGADRRALLDEVERLFERVEEER